MKKIFLLSLYLFVGQIICNSQTSLSPNVDLKIGVPFNRIDGSSSFNYIKDETIITVQYNELYSSGILVRYNVITVNKYNSKTLKYIASNYEGLELTVNGQLSAIKEINGRIYVFYTLLNFKEKSEQLFFREINTSTLNFGEEHLLMKSTGMVYDYYTHYSGFFLDRYSVFTGTPSHKFIIKTSQDTSQILTLYRKEPTNNSRAKIFDKLVLNVLNKKLQTVWTKEITMPYSAKTMNFIDCSVDKDGNVFLLVSNTGNGKQSTIEIFKINANTDKLTSTILETDCNSIANVFLNESPYNISESLVSLYQDNSEEKGSCINSIQYKNNKVYNKTRLKFPLEGINSSSQETKKSDSEENISFDNFKIKGINLQIDGSTIIYGEEVYSNGSQYVMGRLFVCKIDSNGRLEWNKIILKSVLSYYRPSTFAYVKGNDCHYIVFFDNSKNQSLPVNDKNRVRYDYGFDGYLVAYKINDKRGDITKIPIFNTKNNDGLELNNISVSTILQLSAGEFIMKFRTKGDNETLFKVKLN